MKKSNYSDLFAKVRKAHSMLLTMEKPVSKQLLATISDNPGISVSSLVELTKLHQPTVSLYLGLLRYHGLLKSEKDGKGRNYFITSKALKVAQKISKFAKNTDYATIK